MATLTRRLQVLIDEQRFEQLEQVAAERRTTVAALVRHALDQAFPRHGLSPRTAAERFLSRPPVKFGSWDELKAEINEGIDRGLVG